VWKSTYILRPALAQQGRHLWLFADCRGRLRSLGRLGAENALEIFDVELQSKVVLRQRRPDSGVEGMSGQLLPEKGFELDARFGLDRSQRFEDSERCIQLSFTRCTLIS
jgi:hypothetical protein